MARRVGEGISFPLPLAAWTVVLGLLSGCGAKEPAPRTVSVYNWADFIGKHTLQDFEQSTGIKVDYDTFDADSTVEAKMLAGGSGYDVVETSTLLFSRQIKAGAYRTLDRTQLKGLENIDPKILELYARFDPGNAHAVPYLHSLNGFAYDVKKIRERMPKAPVNSLRMIFDPAIASQFADCGITFLDSPRDVIQLALVYLGIDPNSTRKEDFRAAEDLILKVRPYIRNFDSAEYINSLANGETCIAMGWSSDYATAIARTRAAGVKLDLTFTIPKEGSNADYSAFLIPIDAPHVAEAYEFLNFILRPATIAAITNDIFYGNDNRAADALVDPAIRHNPVVYPPPELAKRTFLSAEVSPTTERLLTRSWTRIKTAL
jgi:putrescine transport system substrate-binding protein